MARRRFQKSPLTAHSRGLTAGASNDLSGAREVFAIEKKRRPTRPLHAAPWTPCVATLADELSSTYVSYVRLNLGSRPPEVYLSRETNPLPSRPRAAAVTSKIFLAAAIIVIGAILVAGGAMVVAATAPSVARIFRRKRRRD